MEVMAIGIAVFTLLSFVFGAIIFVWKTSHSQAKKEAEFQEKLNSQHREIDYLKKSNTKRIQEKEKLQKEFSDYKDNFHKLMSDEIGKLKKEIQDSETAYENKLQTMSNKIIEKMERQDKLIGNVGEKIQDILIAVRLIEAQNKERDK